MDQKPYRYSYKYHCLKDAVSKHLPGKISLDELNDLLDFIETSDSLRRLYLIIENISEALKKLEQNLMPSENWKAETKFLSQISRTCQALLSKRKEITTEVKNIDQPEKQKRNTPARGETKTYPFFTTFYRLPELRDPQKYHQLLFHILLTSLLIRPHESGEVQHTNDLKVHALSSIRSLIKEPKHPTIKMLPSGTLKPEQYYEAIKKLTANKHLKAICDFLYVGISIKRQQLAQQQDKKPDISEEEFP